MDNVNTDVETSNTKDHAQPPLPQRDRLPEPTPVEGVGRRRNLLLLVSSFP